MRRIRSRMLQALIWRPTAVSGLHDTPSYISMEEVQMENRKPRTYQRYPYASAQVTAFSFLLFTLKTTVYVPVFGGFTRTEQ